MGKKKSKKTSSKKDPEPFQKQHEEEEVHDVVDEEDLFMQLAEDDEFIGSTNFYEEEEEEKKEISLDDKHIEEQNHLNSLSHEETHNTSMYEQNYKNIKDNTKTEDMRSIRDNFPIQMNINEEFYTSQSHLQTQEVISQFKIKINEYIKEGDGFSSYIVYKIEVETSNSDFLTNEFYSLRRYSDFSWLYDQFIVEYPGCIIPPLPPKSMVSSFVGRFSAELLETRRKHLQTFLRRISNHPELQHANIFKCFLSQKVALSLLRSLYF